MDQRMENGPSNSRGGLHGLTMGFPMVIRKGLPMPRGAPFEFMRDAFPYDYVLTQDEDRPFGYIGDGEPARLIARSGGWTLYRVLH